MVSEDEERRGLTHTITESLTTFTVFLRITLTRIAIDKITLYSTTVIDLLQAIAYWIFWPGIVEWKKIDKVLACWIDGEMIDFLHDGILWDGNISDLDAGRYLELSTNVTLEDFWKDAFRFSFPFELA